MLLSYCKSSDIIVEYLPKLSLSTYSFVFFLPRQFVIFFLNSFFFYCNKIYMGHVYVCLLVALIEVMVFRELVSVRYKDNFDKIQDSIPLFRTTQWLWFFVAVTYTYGEFVADILQSNPRLHYLMEKLCIQYLPLTSFQLYSCTFVMTIASLQREHIKFQINQLCWTLLVLCLTVGQLKYVMHNMFNGFFWFVFPCCLVITNDTGAYIAGMLLGRRLTKRQFISFSPNKTWEGFIGGWFFTMICAWFLSRFLAQYTWMTCPVNEFNFLPQPLECEVDPIFQHAQSILPSELFDMLPRNLAKKIPGVIEMCRYTDQTSDETIVVKCADATQPMHHDHFEMKIDDIYPIQLHSLSLALFASFVAPFGGFLASAIKRAYGVKDFAALIPGHGGVMDRMDCQFIMALCTWVHFNTFVRATTVSVPKLAYLYSLLSPQEKREFRQHIAQAAKLAKVSPEQQYTINNQY